MIFTNLTLFNFAAFRGHHSLNLVPPNRDQPIVLIGALNGSGKTSILDAFQLALYGKRARTSNRGDLPYEEYLRECVHRGCDRAYLRLKLEHRRNGRPREVQVTRTWTISAKTLREDVEVTVDGHCDEVLAASWDDEIESLLPIGIAGLFLFDGEKVEQLAELRQARAVLTTAIDGLLGLDLVTQLEADLKALPQHLLSQARRSGSPKPKVHDARWAKGRRLEGEIEQCDRSIERAAQAAAEAEKGLSAARARFTRIDEQFRRAGGANYEDRLLLKIHLDSAEKEHAELLGHLRNLTIGTLPFVLVKGQLESLQTAVEVESRAKAQKAVIEALEDRDNSLLAHIRASRPAAPIAHVVEAFLDLDRRDRATLASSPVRINMDDSGAAKLRTLGEELKRNELEAKTLVQRLSALEGSIEQARRQLAKVPDEAAITKLAAERDEALRQLASAEERSRAGTASTEAHRAERIRVARELEVVLESLLEDEIMSADERRVIDLAVQIRADLRQFRLAAANEHTARIAESVLECFQLLVRKAGLVDALRIDPETYDIALLDDLGHEISPKRLSAGERQLLAISILWGLGRVSGRVLPTVIDTPLARMDSVHRRNLIEHYFPVASHQVILLSTDEEIHAGWLSVLEPAIGRKYLLVHDEQSKSTSVTVGYFGAPAPQ